MCHAARVPWVASALLGLLMIAVVGTPRERPGPPWRARRPCLRHSPGLAETAVGPDELGFDEIIFVKRKPYTSDHYYTDINSGTSPDRFVAGQRHLCLQPSDPIGAGRRKGCRHAGRQGLYRQDQPVAGRQKVIFDFRQDPGSGFRIWEVDIDGKGLRQSPFRQATRRRRWRGGMRAGTRTTSTPAICRTARSSSPRPDASTRSCAAGPPSLWLLVCTAWTPTAPCRTAYEEPGQRILPGGPR